MIELLFAALIAGIPKAELDGVSTYFGEPQEVRLIFTPGVLPSKEDLNKLAEIMFCSDRDLANERVLPIKFPVAWKVQQWVKVEGKEAFYTKDAGIAGVIEGCSKPEHYPQTPKMDPVPERRDDPYIVPQRPSKTPI